MHFSSLCLLVFALMISGVAEAKKLVVFSSRKEHLVKPLFDLYEKQTGTKVEYLTDKDPILVKKILAEKDKSPADVLLTVDAGNLYLAQQQSLLLPIGSKKLSNNIPAHLRDPKGHWFGLSIRARTMFYDSRKVKPGDLVSYESLADAKWKGKLCLRTSKKVYNQSLVAMMLSHHPKEKVEKVLKGWVANLAAPVFSSDTQLLKAIQAGQCQVGIANSYYFGRLVKAGEAQNVKVFWPNQTSSGAHVNISGAGVVKFSKRKKAAQEFIEWLSEPSAQRVLADANLEYPANPKVEMNQIVKSFGTFEQDKTNLSEAGVRQAQAVMLMDKVGYK